MRGSHNLFYYTIQPPVGTGPGGVTDPVVQDEVLNMGTFAASSALLEEAEAEQQRFAALLEHGEWAEGTNATHYRHQRRRLSPILGQNFAGINNIQGACCVLPSPLISCTLPFARLLLHHNLCCRS